MNSIPTLLDLINPFDMINQLAKVDQYLSTMTPEVSSKKVQNLQKLQRELFVPEIIQSIKKEFITLQSERSDKDLDAIVEKIEKQFRVTSEHFIMICKQTANDLLARKNCKNLHPEEFCHIVLCMQRLFNKLLGLPLSNELESIVLCKSDQLDTLLPNTHSFTKLEKTLKLWFSHERSGTLDISLINTTVFDTLFKFLCDDPESIKALKEMAWEYIQFCFNSTYTLYHRPNKSINGSKETYDARLRCLVTMCNDILSKEEWKPRVQELCSRLDKPEERLESMATSEFIQRLASGEIGIELLHLS